MDRRKFLSVTGLTVGSAILPVKSLEGLIDSTVATFDPKLAEALEIEPSPLWNVQPFGRGDMMLERDDELLVTAYVEDEMYDGSRTSHPARAMPVLRGREIVAAANRQGGGVVWLNNWPKGKGLVIGGIYPHHVLLKGVAEA